DQARDVPVGLREIDLLDPLQRAACRQRAEVLDARARDEHRARLGAQACAAADRARTQRHELLDLLSRPLGIGLAVAALEVPHDPLELRRVGALASIAVAIGHLYRLAVGAVEE